MNKNIKKTNGDFKVVTGADDGREDLGKFRIGQEVEIIYPKDLAGTKGRISTKRDAGTGTQAEYKISTEVSSISWLKEDQIKRI